MKRHNQIETFSEAIGIPAFDASTKFVRNSEGRIVRINDVAILGSSSKNARDYPDAVLAESAALFEEARCYYNHAPDEKQPHEGGRDVRDLFGMTTNPRYVPGEKKIRADINLIPGMGDTVAIIAESMPKAASFSPFMHGRIRHARGARSSVQKIMAVRSVDLVAQGATTGGIFESVQETKSKSKGSNLMEDWSEATMADLRKHRPDIVRDIQEAVKSELKVAEIIQENAALKTKLEKIEEAQQEAKLVALLDGLPEELRESVVPMLKGKSESEAKAFVGNLKNSLGIKDGEKIAEAKAKSMERKATVSGEMKREDGAVNADLRESVVKAFSPSHRFSVL